MKFVHLTLSMFLHYFVKLENYNCCPFMAHCVARKTSEFILPDVRPS